MKAETGIGDFFFAALRPRNFRTFREFAEQELYLATGPRRGLRFSCDFMPWTRLVLEEFDAGRYRRFFSAGPVQSGKTLIFFLLPVMYHLFEVGESVIVGVPKIDMAQGIYDERLLPAIKLSRYASLLPRTGAGSRGGKFVSVTFDNGASLRFMGGGGGDAQRSSHSARVIVLTEVDKMDEAGESSREADPITQLEARARSFGDRARIYGECTLSTRYGRTYQEVVEIGTDTKVYLPCPRCGEYVVPDRSGFAGWQAAETLPDARARAKFTCPKCSGDWSETDRREAMKRPLLAHKGQTVRSDGAVEGEPPATNTFGFRWNAMHNALVTMADIAEHEWRAERSGREDDQKDLAQFVWAEPYEEKILDFSGLTRDMILAKIGAHARGIVPDHAKAVVVAIDLGAYRCWWMATGWTEDAQGYVIDYGALEVPQEREINPASILTTLRAFRNDVLRPGWNRRPDLVLVDSGYAKDICYQFCRETTEVRTMPSKGLGSGRDRSSWRNPAPGPGRQIGNEWLLAQQPEGIALFELHSDYWKRQVHAGLRAPSGTPGSISLFKAEKNHHLGFVRQMLSEREEEEFEPGKGPRRVWLRLHRDNHWFDALHYCRAGADALGIKLEKTPQPVAPRRAITADTQSGFRRIRTRYS